VRVFYRKGGKGGRGADHVGYLYKLGLLTKTDEVLRKGIALKDDNQGRKGVAGWGYLA